MVIPSGERANQGEIGKKFHVPPDPKEITSPDSNGLL
jgi:hypothetical protein